MFSTYWVRSIPVVETKGYWRRRRTLRTGVLKEHLGVLKAGNPYVAFIGRAPLIVIRFPVLPIEDLANDFFIVAAFAGAYSGLDAPGID